MLQPLLWMLMVVPKSFRKRTVSSNRSPSVREKVVLLSLRKHPSMLAAFQASSWETMMTTLPRSSSDKVQALPKLPAMQLLLPSRRLVLLLLLQLLLKDERRLWRRAASRHLAEQTETAVQHRQNRETEKLQVYLNQQSYSILVSGSIKTPSSRRSDLSQNCLFPAISSSAWHGVPVVDERTNDSRNLGARLHFFSPVMVIHERSLLFCVSCQWDGCDYTSSPSRLML